MLHAVLHAQNSMGLRMSVEPQLAERAERAQHAGTQAGPFSGVPPTIAHCTLGSLDVPTRHHSVRRGEAPCENDAAAEVGGSVDKRAATLTAQFAAPYE